MARHGGDGARQAAREHIAVVSPAERPSARDDRVTVADLEFLGETAFPTGTIFDGLEVGGLSGLVFDAASGSFLAISDDRSANARFFRLEVDVADGSLDAGDVVFTDVQVLSRLDGSPFVAFSLDPEGIALRNGRRVYISSEGDRTRDIDPFIGVFRLNGKQIDSLPIDTKFLVEPTTGVRNNLAFESLTLTPNERFLFTATENALLQDGPAATVDSGSLSRIVKYDTRSGLAVAEYAYITEAVADAPNPAGSFATNGLVELLALDNAGTLLAIERSFSTGVGNSIKVFLVRTQGATDISGTPSIGTEIDDGELAANLDAPVQKELLLDLGALGIVLDNIEGVSFGADLPDGRKTLVLVSDNNFSGTQETQVLSFALDLERLPTLRAVAETPDEVRYDGPNDPTEGADPDDPAIYLDPDDAGQSVVITAMKNGGLRVYDLAGNELDRVEPDGIRYNNVDILYGVSLGGALVDIAVASDRANDTLAIYAIDPDTKQLTDITDPGILGTIFGEDDGEATAYGLAAYTSPVDGARYVFVTQADGAKIAQLRITDAGGGLAGATLVRTLELPVPDGDDAADFQSEGIAIDRETGIGYVTVEDELGLLSFEAEPTGSDAFTVVADIDSPFFAPDLEGVAILYGRDGRGAIIVSSQGDSSFAVFDRQTLDYVGSFAVGQSRATDGVEESDGLEIFSGPLGDLFPRGLLVTQDGSNEVQIVFGDPDDGEVQNFNVNFKYVDLRDVVRVLGLDLGDPAFDPRVVPDGLLIG